MNPIESAPPICQCAPPPAPTPTIMMLAEFFFGSVPHFIGLVIVIFMVAIVVDRLPKRWFSKP